MPLPKIKPKTPTRFIVWLGCHLLLWAGFGRAQDNYEIKAFHLEGVHSVSKEALREGLATRSGPWSNRILWWRRDPLFSTEEFERDLRRIIEFYQREGFFHAQIAAHHISANDKKQQVRLQVTVAENQPTRIRDFQLAGTDLPRVDELFKIVKSHLQPGDRLRTAKLRDTQLALATDLANHGFPLVNVETRLQRHDTNKTAIVRFRIKPGPAYVFGNVQVSGATRISPRVVQEQLPFLPGQVFDQSKLIEGQQRVYRLELFQSVNIRALAADSTSREISIEVRVREASVRTLKFGIGYGTEDLFRGSINFRRRNFLGGARRLEVEIKYSDLEPGRVQARIFQPHFFDAKIGLTVTPFYRREAPKAFKRDSLYLPSGLKIVKRRDLIYNLRSFGGELTAQRQFNLFTNTFINYRLEDVNVTPGPAQIDSLMRIPNSYRKATWSLGLLYNSGQPLFAPTRGHYYALQFDYSGKLSEFIFKTEFHYLKTVVEARRYREIAPQVVLAYRLKLGSLEVLDDPNKIAPLEERFYAGGSSSVRGWQRSELGPHFGGTPTGGQSLLEGSVEARFKIFPEAGASLVRALGAALFLDFGNVWSTALTYKIEKIRSALGAGLRYDTPIGPIRFDVARKNYLNSAIEDGRWGYYLSVGQAF